MDAPTAPLLLSTARYEDLAAEMCRLGDYKPLRVRRRRFPDGEHYRQLLDDCNERAIIVLGGTVTDADTLELYDLASGAALQGARSLSLVIPFYGYSTMERAVRDGEIVSAKTRARLLSSIPAAGVGNRVFLVDLHVEGIAHYFEGGMRPAHIDARQVLTRALRELGGDNFVLASTDAGRAKRVESLANLLGCDAAVVLKRRAADHSEVVGVSADVAGRSVVIYDDMVRTGGSLLGAARAYRDAGATQVAAVCTHGVLPGDSLARLADSGLLSALACTDSHPRVRELSAQSDFLRVYPLAQTLVEQLERSR